MAAHSKQRLRDGALAALLLVPAVASAAQSAMRPQGIGVQTIYRAAGARSGSGLTTMASCTNRGSVAGTIGVSFYEFDGTFVCSTFASAVNPGETRTLAAGSVASMANVAVCSGSTLTLHQGEVEIWAQQLQTMRWYCTIQLVAAAADPPTALARLSLSTAGGAPVSDVIFADGFEP